MGRGWYVIRNHWKALLVVPLLGFLAWVFAGITGNRSDAIFVREAEQFSILPEPQKLLFLLLFILVIVIIYVSIQYGRTMIKLRSIGKIAELDDSIFAILPRLIHLSHTDPRRPNAVLQALKECLRDSKRVLGADAHRAILYRVEQEQLVAWAADNFDELPDYRFDIGPNIALGVRRGIAGEAYIQQQIFNVRLEHRAEGWVPKDAAQRRYFTMPATAPGAPEFRSFVAIPIIGYQNAPPLGIVCFDSRQPGRFETSTEGSEEVYGMIAWRIRAVMLLCQSP